MEIAVLFSVVISFFAGIILTPVVASIAKKRGIVGIDVHKLNRPSVPEMGGIAVVSATTVAILLMFLFFRSYIRELGAFLGVGLLICLIGMVDDLRALNPKVKPLLTALGGVPLLVFGVYSTRPMIPFVGATRLTLIYPILLFIGVAVTANAVNMMDVFNGVMPGTCGIIAASTTIALTLLGRGVEASVAAALFGALAAFYVYNRYPAKVFAGDSGSLFVGAMLGSLAIVGRLEIFMVVALMPFIMNAFYSLSSIGRFFERREVTSRPIHIVEDGKLEASQERKAPLTLARLILIHGTMDEKSVTYVMMVLTAISSGLALVTLFLIPGMR